MTTLLFKRDPSEIESISSVGGAYATSCNADLIDCVCEYSNVIVNNDPDFDPVIFLQKGIRNPLYHGRWKAYFNAIEMHERKPKMHQWRLLLIR